MTIRLVKILCFCLCLFLPRLAVAASATWQPLDGLLHQYVADGDKEGIKAALVDYRGWARDPRYPQAMMALQRIDPSTLSPREAMVFWINTYADSTPKCIKLTIKSAAI